MSEKRSKFQGLFPIEPPDPVAAAEEAENRPLVDDHAPAAGPEDRTQRPPRNQASKISRNQASKISRNQGAEGPLRLKTNYEIRQDYHRKLKNIANDEGLKMYQVIEEAIGRYLKSKGRL